MFDIELIIRAMRGIDAVRRPMPADDAKQPAHHQNGAGSNQQAEQRAKGERQITNMKNEKTGRGPQPRKPLHTKDKPVGNKRHDKAEAKARDNHSNQRAQQNQLLIFRLGICLNHHKPNAHALKTIKTDGYKISPVLAPALLPL